jgi:hypothetical protein
MSSSLTTFAALMKEKYEDSDIVEQLVYPQNVLLGMLEKRGDQNMVGNVLPVPYQTANPQSVGGTFSATQTIAGTAAGSTVWHQLNIEAGDYFGDVEIGDKVMKMSRSNRGAFLANKEVEIDGLYETAGESLNLYAWGNGGCALGRVAAVEAAGAETFTLENASDAANFEIGMEIVASASDGSVSTHSLNAAGAIVDVTAVNRATGVITLEDLSDISLAVGDYVFRQNDFFGDTGNVILKGVEAFITRTDSPAALWGVAAATRALDPQRHAGYRINSSEIIGKTIEERIRILCAQGTSRFKARPFTAGFLHPEDFVVLETLMASKGQRALEDKETKFGYMKIDVVTGSGRIPIYCDRHCPRGHFFGLRMENWWLSSVGELLHPQEEDGMVILRKATSTNYEYRLLSYPLIACSSMKDNGRVPISASA